MHHASYRTQSLNMSVCRKAAGVVPVAEKELGPAAASLADALTPWTGTHTPATNAMPAFGHSAQEPHLFQLLGCAEVVC